LRREVAELAVQAAGAVINANLDNERNRQLVDELIAGVPAPSDK
jgi:F0F1-type ATP synthase membrane subunit b/b'